MVESLPSFSWGSWMRSNILFRSLSFPSVAQDPAGWLQVRDKVAACSDGGAERGVALRLGYWVAGAGTVLKPLSYSTRRYAVVLYTRHETAWWWCWWGVVGELVVMLLWFWVCCQGYSGIDGSGKTYV